MPRCVRDLCADCDLYVPHVEYSTDIELWRLSLATLEWTSIEETPGGAAPSARYGHVMTSIGLDLWVHGGDTETGEGDSCATHLALLLLPR